MKCILFHFQTDVWVLSKLPANLAHIIPHLLVMVYMLCVSDGIYWNLSGFFLAVKLKPQLNLLFKKFCLEDFGQISMNDAHNGLL